MDQVAFVMEVLETEQHLFCDDSDKSTWYTFLLMSLYKRQEVLAKWFKDDANMGCFGALV
jgi:hypothetical protein